MTFSVAFHPLAKADLFGLYDYLESRTGPAVAGGYLDRIETLCLGLASLPMRGAARDDLGVGIRTIAMERRVLVAYRSTGEDVLILRVLYAGRDFGVDDLPE